MTDTISLAKESQKRLVAHCSGQFLAVFKRAHDGRPITISSPGVAEGLLVTDSAFALHVVPGEPEAYQAVTQKLAMRFIQGAAIGVCAGGANIDIAKQEAAQCALEGDCDVVFNHNDKIVTAYAGGQDFSEERIPGFGS